MVYVRHRVFNGDYTVNERAVKRDSPPPTSRLRHRLCRETYLGWRGARRPLTVKHFTLVRYWCTTNAVARTQPVPARKANGAQLAHAVIRPERTYTAPRRRWGEGDTSGNGRRRLEKLLWTVRSMLACYVKTNTCAPAKRVACVCRAIM